MLPNTAIYIKLTAVPLKLKQRCMSIVSQQAEKMIISLKYNMTMGRISLGLRDHVFV